MLPDSLPYMKSDEAIARQLTELNKKVELLDSQRSGAERLIDSVVLAAPAALITFANIPNIYANLIIRWYARSNGAAGGVSLTITFNNDVGNNYDYISSQIWHNSLLATSEGVGVANIFVGQCAGNTAPADVFDMGEIQINAYGNAIGEKTLIALFGRKAAEGSGQLFVRHTQGWWRDTSPITEIDIAVNLGGFIAGSRFDLYGIQGGV